MNGQDFSVLDIFSTSALVLNTGGIWELNLVDSTRLNLIGGQIRNLDIKESSTAVLRGGRIDNIGCWQTVLLPHIEMIVKDYSYNAQTKILKGTWGDDSLFNIQLIDHIQDGYSPAIDNIKFTIIPEPMSLMLIGLGALLIRRR